MKMKIKVIGKTLMRRAIFFNQGKMRACGANGSLAALMVWFPTPLLAERK